MDAQYFGAANTVYFKPDNGDTLSLATLCSLHPLITANTIIGHECKKITYTVNFLVGDLTRLLININPA